MSFYILPISIGLAFVLDLIIGDPYWFPHPVIYIGKLVSGLEKAVRNSKLFTSEKKQKLCGLLIWVSTVAVTAIVTYLLVSLFDRNVIMVLLVNAIVICICLSTKCLGKEAKKVYYKLDDIDEARVQLSYIVGRDTSNLSEEEIIRATVETVAENTVDGTIATMMYAFIGGPILSMVYKAVNTMDSMLGYKNERFVNIGMFSAILDDIFNYIPARFSLVSFAIASFFLGYDWKNCVVIGIRDRKNHNSPNCAIPEGAVAGALGVQLGGTNVYFGEEVYKPTIGDKNRNLEREDIIRTIRLMNFASLISLMIFLIIYMVFIVLRCI